MGQFFYDRVFIYVDGQAYLPDGQIRSFGMSVRYSSRQQMGMTSDGYSAGQIVGNSVVDSVTWVELLPTAAEIFNWRSFLIANPNSVISVIPVSLATGVPTAPNFTISGLNCTSQDMSAPGESESCVRTITFNAQSSSNT